MSSVCTYLGVCTACEHVRTVLMFVDLRLSTLLCSTQNTVLLYYYSIGGVLLYLSFNSTDQKGTIITRSYPIHPNIVNKVIAETPCQDLALSLRLIKQLREQHPEGKIHSDTQHITLAELAAYRKNIPLFALT